AMPIDMERSLRRECLFRILPKFRIRADGEPVRVGDAVVFKSVSTEAHLNHAKFKFHNDTAMITMTGQGYFESTVNSPTMEVREACASMPQHGWTMKVFRSAQTAEFIPTIQPSYFNSTTVSTSSASVTGGAGSPTSPAGVPPTVGETPNSYIPVMPSISTANRIVQGGKFIRLYHKERNGYLSCPSFLSLAESTFDAGGVDEQKVQLMEYHFDPLNPQDGSSCLSMWQVENAVDMFGGEAVEWGALVRLRHAASNMYLSVRREHDFSVDDGETISLLVDLTPTPAGPSVGNRNGGADRNISHSNGVDLPDSTVFVFAQGKTAAAFDATSAHAENPTQHTLARTMGVSPSPLSLTDRNAYFIVASYENHMDDYFSISLVEPELVDKFNYVHSYAPWILQFVAQSRKAAESKGQLYPIKTKEDRTLRMILSSLIYFCTKSHTVDPMKREGTPILLHQTLLRETSIIEILIKFLKYPFNPEDRFSLQTALYELEIGCSSDDLLESRSAHRESPKDSGNIQVTLSTSDSDGDGISVPIISSTHESRAPGAVRQNLRRSSRFDTGSSGSLSRDQATVRLGDIKNGTQEGLVRIFRFIYRVLKQYLLGSEKNNQSHIADKFMILSEHIDLNVGAADTLMQLIDGNPALVQRITNEQIESFIGLLAKDRNPSYVNFLIAMCYCDGVSMPAHQFSIAQKLFAPSFGEWPDFVPKAEDDLPIHLFKTRISESGSLEVLPATEKVFRRWVPLHELCQKVASHVAPRLMTSLQAAHERRRTMSSSRGAASSSDVRGAEVKKGIPNRVVIAAYYEVTLKLYKALCLGQNSEVIDLLTNKWGIVSLKECFIGMCDDNLPDNIRGLYGDLIRIVFVDRFPITPVRSTYIFPIASISKRPTFEEILEDSSIKANENEDAIFQSTAQWVEKFLTLQTSQIAANASANHFMLSMLRLTKCLVQHGYIREEARIKELFRILMLVLDGKTDLRDCDMIAMGDFERARTPWATKERFELNELNQPIIHSKIEICLIMEQLLQLRLEMRSHLFLYHWHQYFRAGGKRYSDESKKPDIAFGFRNVQTLLAYIMDETAYFRLRDVLSPILLELLRYESPKLKQCAIRLLHRMFSSIEELLDINKTAVILNDTEHIQSYQWIKAKIRIFIENGVGTSALSETSGDVILGGIGFDTAFKMKSLLIDLGNLCILGSKTTGPSESDQVQVGSGEIELPDTITQMEMRNLSIHSWVIQMLKNRLSHAVAESIQKISEAGVNGAAAMHSPGGSPNSRSNDAMASSVDSLLMPSVSCECSTDSISAPLKKVQSDILVAAFEFLYRFSKGNKQHMNLLFDHFELLIECTNPRLSGASPEVSFACVQVLGRMLSQSVETCLRLNEHHISQILELSHGYRPEYIRLLKYIIRVEGKVLKRNQSLIMKLLLENRKLYINLTVLLDRFKGDLDEDVKAERKVMENSELMSSTKDRRFSMSVGFGSKMGSSKMGGLDVQAPSTPHLNRRSSRTIKKENEECQRRDDNVPLEYFEDVIFLLSECCEEKNYMMQLMCQTIFSVSEILSLMNSKTAPLRLKSGLASLLVTSYIQATGEEDNEKHPERIQKDRRSWKFLEFVSEFVRDSKKTLQRNKPLDKDVESFLFGGALKFVESFFKYCVAATANDQSGAYEISSTLVDDLTALAKLVESTKKHADAIVLAIRSIVSVGFEGNKCNGTEENGLPSPYVHTTEYIENHNVDAVNKTLVDVLQRISEDPAILAMNTREFTMLAHKFSLAVDRKMSQQDFAYNSGVAIQTAPTLKRRHKRQAKSSSTGEEIKYDIKTLKILEWLVTEEIAAVDSIDRTKNGDKWAKAEHKKIEVQKLLSQLGCTLMAERLLTSERKGLFSASLRVLIVLLDGGNKVIQNTLESYWLGTREERFFYCIHETIKKFVVQVREAKMQQEAKIANNQRSSTTSLSNKGSMESLHKSQSQISVDQNFDPSSVSNIASMNANDSPSVAGSGGIEDGEYSAIRSVMRLLQLLVEGHNFRIQEYMRTQPDNIKTFNLIRQVVDFLHAIVSIESTQVVPVLIQVFDTLIDLSQGCTQNQVAIFQAKIVHAVNFIWIQEYHDCSEDQILELKGKGALTLLSLLEDDTDDETRAVFKQMAMMFDLRALLENLDAVHKKVSDEEEEKKKKTREQIKNMARKEVIFEQMKHLYGQARNIGSMFIKDTISRWKKSELPPSVVQLFASVKALHLPFVESADDAVPLDKSENEMNSKGGKNDEAEPLLLSSDKISSEVDIVSHRSSVQHGSFASLQDDGENLNEKNSNNLNENDENEAEIDENDDDECSPRETGFIYSMLIATLLPYMSLEHQDLCERSVSFNSFNNKTGRIEIVRELNNATEKRLYTVLFPIPDICFFIKGYTKDRFLWMRKRNTPQEKVEDFVNQSQDIIYEIRNQALVEENIWLKTLAQGHSYWWRGAYMLSFLINIGNMMCMIAPTGDVASDDFSKCPAFVDHGRTFLGLIQIMFWVCSLALPLLVNRKRIQRLIDENAKIRKENEQRLWSGGEKIETKSVSELQSLGLTPNDLIRGFFNEPKALYHASMVFLAILGLQYPSLYAIHLLDFMYRDEVLQGVIASVTLNWSSLSKTVILGVIIIYIYSVIGFVWFRHAFSADEGLHCHSLFSCFMTVLSYGLRSGGGIGELLQVPVDESKEYYGARVLLDLSFFLVVIVFLLNVVFGIIFDTFGQLREERKDISDDLRTQCFVCSINASEFQRHSSGFENHIKKEHNVWHYLFFLVHLELKDKTEYTSHETFISESLAKNDLSFFPINRAIALKNWEEADNVVDKIAVLEQSVRSVMESMNGVRMQLHHQMEYIAREVQTATAKSSVQVERRPSKLSSAVEAAMAASRFNKGKRTTAPSQ
ncbi:hypothetical protein BDR26DRAFT_869940, partial [Obelidium mucronatum]